MTYDPENDVCANCLSFGAPTAEDIAARNPTIPPDVGVCRHNPPVVLMLTHYGQTMENSNIGGVLLPKPVGSPVPVACQPQSYWPSVRGNWTCRKFEQREVVNKAVHGSWPVSGPGKTDGQPN